MTFCSFSASAFKRAIVALDHCIDRVRSMESGQVLAHIKLYPRGTPDKDQRDQLVMAATDGKILGEWILDNQAYGDSILFDCREAGILVPHSFAKHLGGIKPAKKGGKLDLAIRMEEGGWVRMQSRNESWHIPAFEGAFPAYQAALDPLTPPMGGPPFGFDAAYLEKVRKVLDVRKSDAEEDAPPWARGREPIKMTPLRGYLFEPVFPEHCIVSRRCLIMPFTLAPEKKT